MSREAFERGRCRQSTQDGSREFITLIACVSALGIAIPPVLLYKGASGDLQDSWVEKVTEEDDVWFGVTENGWTNDAYGMKWLTDVFEPSTRPKSPRTKRLLIVDGHSSHVNLRFIEWANTHGIIILILPPHSTHRLQPLDLNCFQPLATKYQVYLDQWLLRSVGQVSMTKRNFYEIFKPSWLESFSKSNICGGFKKAGIWPYSPLIVLDVIKLQPQTPPKDDDEPIKPPPTPMTSKSIRRIQKAYKSNPSPALFDLILRSQERLAAQHEIDKHITQGLLETLKEEKKRRKRGKRLNLVGEEDSGAQLFHSSKVQAALAYKAEKEAKLAVEKAKKASKKAKGVENRQRKEEQAKERALQRQVAAEAKAKAKAEKLAAKEARKKALQAKKDSQKKSLIVVLQLKKPSKELIKVVRFEEEVEVVREVGGSHVQGTRTRAISLPQRYKN